MTLTKQLRLSGILGTLEKRNRQAIDGELADTDFLALLIQDELARRDQAKLLNPLHAARAAGNYERRLRKLVRVSLIVVDGFVLKPITAPDDEAFHDLAGWSRHLPDYSWWRLYSDP